MTSIVSSILGVFTSILEWFVTTLGTVGEIFYVAETGLTLIGTLTVIGLGIAVVIMVINMIKGLMRLR